MGKIINQTLCLLLRSVIEMMPVIKISLPHLYFKLSYSFGNGLFLKFKLHFPEEFPHAFKDLMICSCLDWYKYPCIHIFTYVQINVTVHNTNEGVFLFSHTSDVLLLLHFKRTFINHLAEVHIQLI